MVALRGGALETARQQSRTAVEFLEAYGDTRVLWFRHAIIHTHILAVSGDGPAAARSLGELERHRHPAFGHLEPELMIAAGWVSAAQGAILEAIATARAAADYASVHGQFAWEVMALQTATQFGDTHTGPRLAVLATTVEGLRAPAAAAYATALGAGDAAGLAAASTRFEAMDDVLAAADASAHAAVAYRRQNMRGSALTAAARAQRISCACGASSPALREAIQPLPLTEREREVAILASNGMSNRAIAAQLTMSVRTVEGHLYRATSKVGARSRKELRAIIRGD